MLTEFIYQWNPFNVYGSRVEVEDLICNPLQTSETLMQDGNGHCRRIKVPPLNSSLWDKFIFWVQTHLNQKGHLDAIDNLISLFNQRLLQHPPQKTEKLQEIDLQISKLKLLKNDYCFTQLHVGDDSFIDLRLDEIEKHAYAVFTCYHIQQVLEEEKSRKQAFIIFQEQVEQQLQVLALEYCSGLIKARLLMMIPATILREFFEERVISLNDRLQIITELHQQINEMEKIHKGKFTISYFNSYLDRIRVRLSNEVCKINIEIEILIRNLILNYRLSPVKEAVKGILDSIEVNPEELRSGRGCAYMFQETLESEINRIKSIFNEKIEEGE